MDESTDKMMRKPRCGMPDVMKKRIKRFSVHGSKWRLKNIEYNVVYPANIPHEQIDSNWFKRAFKEWTKYTGIKFHSNAERNADIQITFKDMQPVGNMTTLLGSAFFPIHGGGISFNGNIPWFSNDCEVNFIILLYMRLDTRLDQDIREILEPLRALCMRHHYKS